MIKEKTLDRVPEEPDLPQKPIKLMQIGKTMHNKCCKADWLSSNLIFIYLR